MYVNHLQKMVLSFTSQYRDNIIIKPEFAFSRQTRKNEQKKMDGRPRDNNVENTLPKNNAIITA